MKSEFVQPRFAGARFAEHTLPLDVAKDLAAYETLVVELAKRLYLADHPERQRVPKGFGADFHLHIERLDDGSASPLLSVVTSAALVPGGGFNEYFERARELTTECIAAVGHPLPDKFPPELLVHFNQIGRSLQSDERVEFPSSGGKAVLTQERRKELVLLAGQVYEREFALSGTIEEVDWAKSTFRFCSSDGDKLLVPLTVTFDAQARFYGGKPRHQVTICGVGAYDARERLQSIVSVESLEVQPDYQLAARLDELQSLEDGWYDGQGKAPPKDALDRISAALVGNYPENLPLPAIVPTPEGNLLLEWDAPGTPSLDLDLSSFAGYFHALDSEGHDMEREVTLTDTKSWNALFSMLGHALGQIAA